MLACVAYMVSHRLTNPQRYHLERTAINLIFPQSVDGYGTSACNARVSNDRRTRLKRNSLHRARIRSSRDVLHRRLSSFKCLPRRGLKNVTHRAPRIALSRICRLYALIIVACILVNNERIGGIPG